MKLRWMPMDSPAAPPPHSAPTTGQRAHRAMSHAEMRDKAGHATILLKSMANETRLMILCQLVEGERSVSQLLETTPLGQSALSQHLAVLRRERLVTARREAQSVYYSLASHEVRAIIQTLYDLFCGCD
jgi:ArsR family transcriptional regulator, virulence genes transcriptional regulator